MKWTIQLLASSVDTPLDSDAFEMLGEICKKVYKTSFGAFFRNSPVKAAKAEAVLNLYGMKRSNVTHGEPAFSGDQYLYRRSWDPEKSDFDAAFAFTCDFYEMTKYSVAEREEIEPSSVGRALNEPKGRYLGADKILRLKEGLRPDVAIYGNKPRGLMVSDRLRRAIEDAGLKGFVFEELGAAVKVRSYKKAFETGFYYRAVAWEDKGFEPYWLVALVDGHVLPYESDQITSIERNGIVTEDDLKYTTPLIKYERQGLKLLDSFDVAFTTKSPRSRNYSRYTIAGDAVLSRRFIELCESIQVRGAKWFPVYKLNETGEPMTE